MSVMIAFILRLFVTIGDLMQSASGDKLQPENVPRISAFEGEDSFQRWPPEQ
jgi:hypothetical protein